MLHCVLTLMMAVKVRCRSEFRERDQAWLCIGPSGLSKSPKLFGKGKVRRRASGIVQQMTIVDRAQRLFSPEPIVVVPGCYAVIQFYG